MSDFKWAFSEKANLKEPIEALKKDGWQYADIPTASNFNWLFREIQLFLEDLESKLDMLKPLTEQALKTANEAIERCDANHRESEFNLGVSRQICRQLRAMEKELQKHIPEFSAQPWPLNDAGDVG